MKQIPHSLLIAFALSSSANAAVIGFEDFAYADGAIAGQTGGTGFDWNHQSSTHTTTVSDWDNTGGTPQVSSGALVTDGTSAKREYNGPTEGSGGPDGDGTERSGALRGAGVVFYRFDITRSSGASWSGLSSYDFGSERLFFGVATDFAGGDEVSIQIAGTATNISSGISLADNTTHTLVAVLDFDNDLAGIWANPTSADDWDGTGGTADATLAYTASNWSSAVRFGSGGQTTWDNLTIATTPEEVGLLGVPEPSSAALMALGAMTLLRRRR